MGINYNHGSLQLLQDFLTKSRLILPGLKMAELGNMHVGREVVFPDAHRFRERILAKHIFAMFGVDHTSFDWNGRGGVVKIDLREPIPDEYRGQFDVVTNFGTTEHVKNQYQVWKNIHDFCRPLGWMLHSVPAKGSCKGHSPYHYTVAWMFGLASDCKYTIHNIHLDDKPGNHYVCALLQKSDGTFPDKKDFQDP